MSQLLLLDRMETVHSTLSMAVLAPLHSRTGMVRRRQLQLLSPCVEIDRAKYKHRQEWGLRALFQCACWGFEVAHGFRASNDYHSSSFRSAAAPSGELVISYKGQVIVSENATVRWES